jgi:hypothetical protein
MNNLVKYIHANVAYYIDKQSLELVLNQYGEQDYEDNLPFTLKRRSQHVLDLRTNEVIKARHHLEDLFDTLLKDNDE